MKKIMIAGVGICMLPLTDAEADFRVSQNATPALFRFQLTKEERENLRCQIETSSQASQLVTLSTPDLRSQSFKGRDASMTDDGIKYHLDQLRRDGRIRHIGPTKGGHWEVLP